LRKAQRFTFRGEQYEVIVCISDEDKCLQNAVCRRDNGSTCVIQFHKNFVVAATGDPEPVEVLSMTGQEIEECEPWRD